jgi:hypothetical protein
VLGMQHPTLIGQRLDDRWRWDWHWNDLELLNGECALRE